MTMTNIETEVEEKGTFTYIPKIRYSGGMVLGTDLPDKDDDFIGMLNDELSLSIASIKTQIQNAVSDQEIGIPIDQEWLAAAQKALQRIRYHHKYILAEIHSRKRRDRASESERQKEIERLRIRLKLLTTFRCLIFTNEPEIHAQYWRMAKEELGLEDLELE